MGRTVDGRFARQDHHNQLEALEVGLEVAEHGLHLVRARRVLTEARLKHAYRDGQGTRALEREDRLSLPSRFLLISFDVFVRSPGGIFVRLGDI